LVVHALIFSRILTTMMQTFALMYLISVFLPALI
jgi:hypothetical protein